MSNYPLEDILRARKTTITGVREKSYGKLHEVYGGAPCDWSKAQGATHTLYCGETSGLYGRPGTGTRPAKLLKTVLYVGNNVTDEDQIIWDKWDIKTIWENANKN
jgi:hypothetical protein